MRFTSKDQLSIFSKCYQFNIGSVQEGKGRAEECVLCRYDQVVKEGGQEPHAWRPAALCYRAAAAVVPSCGNAYSQLAVLSTCADHAPAPQKCYMSCSTSLHLSLLLFPVKLAPRPKTCICFAKENLSSSQLLWQDFEGLARYLVCIPLARFMACPALLRQRKNPAGRTFPYFSTSYNLSPGTYDHCLKSEKFLPSIPGIYIYISTLPEIASWGSDHTSDDCTCLNFHFSS